MERKKIIYDLMRELDRIDPMNENFPDIRNNITKLGTQKLIALLEKFRNKTIYYNASSIITFPNKNIVYNYFVINGHNGFAHYSRSWKWKKLIN